MSDVKIKICGIQDADSAGCAFRLGANYLGFIFADSPRRISTECARLILGSLPSGVLSVGVFMNQPPADVAEIARLSGITHIQLHGDEDSADFRHLGLHILKAVPVTPAGVVGPFSLGVSDFALLDTRVPGRHGGTGTPFDWNQARSGIPEKPFFVAGGLTPENVRQAIEILSPYGVDVCSGVERDGKKCPERMARFIREIRRTP